MTSGPAEHRHNHEPPREEDEAGALVRPYTVTGGRTRPVGGRWFGLMDRVTAGAGPVPGHLLDHARTTLLDMVRQEPRVVAELAAYTDLPLTVVQVLLGDLADAGAVRVQPPPAPEQAPDVELLREVIHGLRML